MVWNHFSIHWIIKPANYFAAHNLPAGLRSIHGVGVSCTPSPSFSWYIFFILEMVTARGSLISTGEKENNDKMVMVAKIAAGPVRRGQTMVPTRSTGNLLMKKSSVCAELLCQLSIRWLPSPEGQEKQWLQNNRLSSSLQYSSDCLLINSLWYQGWLTRDD